jgi:hypothetical protein
MIVYLINSAAALSCSFAPYKSFVSLLFQYIYYMSYNIIRITILLLYHLWDKVYDTLGYRVKHMR